MSRLHLRRVAPLLLLIGCTSYVGEGPGDEVASPDDIETGAPSGADDKGDAPGWARQVALHLGESRYQAVDPGGRHVYSMWVAGSADQPVPLTISVAGQDAAAVRVAVLGPLVGGAREVLGAAGYDAPIAVAAVEVAIDQPGQIVVVVGSYRLASFAGYQVSARCAGDGCGPDRVDALATPKLGGLVGTVLDDGSTLVQTTLEPTLAVADKFPVELWRSPPAMRWAAERLAVSESSGNQANFILPAGAIADGDDLMFVVLPGDGLPSADVGVWARFAPTPAPMARLDAILYSDLGAITVTGVTGYFEGHDLIALRRAADGTELVVADAQASLPGTPGMGLGAFEVTLAPPLMLADGSFNPDLPRDGEVLSVGRILGDGRYAELGCFEFCNDLAGTGTCASGPVDCP